MCQNKILKQFTFHKVCQHHQPASKKNGLKWYKLKKLPKFNFLLCRYVDVKIFACDELQVSKMI